MRDCLEAVGHTVALDADLIAARAAVKERGDMASRGLAGFLMAWPAGRLVPLATSRASRLTVPAGPVGSAHESGGDRVDVQPEERVRDMGDIGGHVLTGLRGSISDCLVIQWAHVTRVLGRLLRLLTVRRGQR
jgi:hypothetical protein